MSGVPSAGFSPYLAPRQPRFAPWLNGPLQASIPPAGQVVSLLEARAQLLWDSDDETQDQRITANIITATRMCEQEISGHRQFLTATYDMPVEDWWGIPQKFPRPPLRTVNAVTYFDSGGNLQTLDPSIYIVRVPLRMPGTIERAPNQAFPSYQGDRRQPININFTCGYASPMTVNIGTSTFTVLAETYTNGQILQVSCSTDGSLPTPLLPDTNYYVVNVSGNNFQLSATSGGGAITLTAASQPAALLFTGRVPETIRQAILMGVVDLIRNRGDISEARLQRMEDLLLLEGYGSYA